MIRCLWCGDEFDPTESSDRMFCSWRCLEKCEARQSLNDEAYKTARYGGAAVFE